VTDKNGQESSEGEVADAKHMEPRPSREQCLSRLRECGCLEVEPNTGEQACTYRLTGKGIIFLEKVCDLLELFCGCDKHTLDNLPDRFV
jgi:hypothetical protein